MDRLALPPRVRVVQDVVVDEGRGVDHLDRRRQLQHPFVIIAIVIIATAIIAIVIMAIVVIAIVIIATPNLATNIVGFRGFDSSIMLCLRGGMFMSIGNLPESLTRAMLVGTMLVGRLGVHPVHD